MYTEKLEYYSDSNNDVVSEGDNAINFQTISF